MQLWGHSGTLVETCPNLRFRLRLQVCCNSRQKLLPPFRLAKASQSTAAAAPDRPWDFTGFQVPTRPAGPARPEIRLQGWGPGFQLGAMPSPSGLGSTWQATPATTKHYQALPVLGTAHTCLWSVASSARGLTLQRPSAPAPQRAHTPNTTHNTYTTYPSIQVPR